MNGAPGGDGAAAAAQAQPLAQHGANQHSEPEEEDVRSEPPQPRGETQTYLLRRLARDAPEILEEVKEAIELRKHGRPKKGQERKGDQITLKRGTTGAAYIRARLIRPLRPAPAPAP